MQNFAIIVAVDQKNGIGKNNTLAWHLPSELKYFSKLSKTTRDPNKKNAVIMGRNTWESLPLKYKPLPGRFNVVLSSNPNLPLPENVLLATSLDQALSELEKDQTIENIFVIGGAKVYQDCLYHSACELIYLTQIEAEFACDTFFPQIDSSFELISKSELHEDKGYKYRYLLYKRKHE